MKSGGELILGIIWMGLGILIAVSSYKLKLGTPMQIGPGLMPFVLGILLLLCSIPIILRSLRKRKGGGGGIRVWEDWNLKTVGIIMGFLFLYGVVLNRIGFILTTFIVFLPLYKIAGIERWRTALIVSILTVISTYVVFHVILEVQLPLGIWRIG